MRTEHCHPLFPPKADAGEGRLSGGAPSIKGAGPRVMAFPFCFVLPHSQLFGRTTHTIGSQNTKKFCSLCSAASTPPGNVVLAVSRVSAAPPFGPLDRAQGDESVRPTRKP